jgi:hypothetical protein
MPLTMHRAAGPMTRSILALTVIALFAGPAAGAAQNLLVNPNFDTSLTGWQVLGPGTWDGTLDGGGFSRPSGSAKGVTTQPGGIDAIVAQCVPLDIGATYHFGGRVFIPGGNTASADVFFILIPFPQEDCQGPPPPAGGFLQTGDVTRVGAWIDSEIAFTNTFALSGQIWATIAPQTTGSFQANFDNMVVAPGVLPCPSDVAGSLCLFDARFTVSAGFKFANGDQGLAQAVPLGDGNSSGYYWFFDVNNPEVMVKLINGCAVNGHYWFFAAGLTNLEVGILIMDAQTGARKVYTNPANTAFAPIQDTAALACP